MSIEFFCEIVMSVRNNFIIVFYKILFFKKLNQFNKILFNIIFWLIGNKSSLPNITINQIWAFKWAYFMMKRKYKIIKKSDVKIYHSSVKKF